MDLKHQAFHPPRSAAQAGRRKHANVPVLIPIIIAVPAVAMFVRFNTFYAVEAGWHQSARPGLTRCPLLGPCGLVWATAPVFEARISLRASTK